MTANDDPAIKLTFAQRVGGEPIPSLLRPDQISNGLRASMWAAIFASICENLDGSLIGKPWEDVLYRKHVYFDHGMADEFTNEYSVLTDQLNALFRKADHVAFYGCVEFLLRDHECPRDLAGAIDEVFTYELAPYRISGGDTLVPITSSEQGQLLAHALDQLKKLPLAAVSQHLRQSVEFLNKGQWAKSIVESIHAVESIARKIEPSATTLDPALKKLAPKVSMHPALHTAFSKLYGYTSDQQGIRHALVDQSAAAADRDDAIFMVTACAAFSSYLASKATAAKLL